MTSITLRDVWLQSAADSTDGLSFPAHSVSLTKTLNRAQVRTYAGGRRRLVKGTGVATTFNLRLPAVSAAELEWINEHEGQIIVVRDTKGRVIVGAYLIVPVTDRVTTASDTEIVIEELTHSLEV